MDTVVTKTVSVPKISTVQTNHTVSAPVVPVSVEKTDLKSAANEVQTDKLAEKVAEKLAVKPETPTKTEEKDVLDKKNEVEKAEPEDKKDPKETARWAALTKKERQLELESTNFRNEKKQFESEKEKVAQFNKDLEQIKNNPKMALDVLEKLGIPFTKLADYILNPEEVDKDFEAKRFREQYEADKLAREKAEKENLTKQEQANITSFKVNLNKFIDGEDGNNDAYPLIRANLEYDLVYDVMNEQWLKDKTVMDRSVAARHVEDYLQEKLDRQIKAKKLSVVSESKSIGESEKTINSEIKAKKEILPKKAIQKTANSKPNLTNLKTISNPITKSASQKSRYERAIEAFRKAKGE